MVKQYATAADKQKAYRERQKKKDPKYLEKENERKKKAYVPRDQLPEDKLKEVRVYGRIASGLFREKQSVAVFGQQPGIELQITETHVRPGRDITLTCRVTNKGDNAVHIAKGFVENDGTLRTDILSSNTALLLNNPRYKLDMFPIAEVKLYNLVISNVTYEDSGSFVCLLAEDNSVRDMVELFVYHPIAELSFNNYTAGETVRVNDTTELELVCQASGSIPAANVKVTLGSEDITEKFRKNTHSTSHCTDGSIISKKCLVHQTHTITATMPGFKPKWTDNMKRLSCLANVENSGFDSKEVSFQIEMHYPPKFIPGECQSIAAVRLHYAHEISCKISSNPSNPEFYWSFMWGGNEQKLYKDQTSNDGEFKAGQRNNADGTVSVWLRVRDVSSRHLMTYHLTANNTLGSNETTVTLQEDNSIPNGASSAKAATIILLPIFLQLKNLL